MGYIGQAPPVGGVTSSDINDGTITNDDIASDAAISMSKTALVDGTGVTLSTNTLSVDASQTQITAVGTIATGTWEATDVAIAHGGTGASSAADAKTNLGVGTGDSPQFTGIELGHASDTTIARSGAGDITIEGNAVYRAGGTDVPVADGGTGASTLTDGGVLVGNGTGAVQATAVGTSGQVLTSNGAGVDPTFQDAAAGATIVTGEYTGNASTDQTISGLGITPELVISVRNDGGQFYMATTEMDTDSKSMNYAVSDTTERLKTFASGSFIATGNSNINGSVYYYYAIGS